MSEDQTQGDDRAERQREADERAPEQVTQDPDAPGLGAADETDDLGDAPEPNEPA